MLYGIMGYFHSFHMASMLEKALWKALKVFFYPKICPHCRGSVMRLSHEIAQSVAYSKLALGVNKLVRGAP